jgi:hypothetical protein
MACSPGGLERSATEAGWSSHVGATPPSPTCHVSAATARTAAGVPTGVIGSSPAAPVSSSAAPARRRGRAARVSTTGHMTTAQ